MVDRALDHRVETNLASVENPEDWDFQLLRQELLMHYLLTVPQFEDGAEGRPDAIPDAQQDARDAGHAAFDAKFKSLNEFGMQLLSYVMLNVLDEKWKDHLYDLDQLRAAIQYRGWGQTDPLIEYKKEAYNMFVDLMNDVYNTFTERFLRAQLVFAPPETAAPSQARPNGTGPQDGSTPGRGPTRRYNALGILEDVPAEEPEPAKAAEPAPAPAGASASPQPPRKAPTVVGAGRARTLGDTSKPANVDWSKVRRNDPCPCGSGLKYKKCHGANA